MDRHTTVRLAGLAVVLVLIALPAGAAETGALLWDVVANGVSGTLEIAATSEGRIEGTLLGKTVEGWLVGRHLVLVREGAAGTETWEAWLATPESSRGEARPVLAGTFTRPDAEGPLPWFGTPPLPSPARTDGAGTTPADRPVRLTAPAAQQPATSGVPAVPASGNTPRSDTAVPKAAGPRLPSGQPRIAGTWETPDGPLEILQDGSRLTFVLPDRRVDGRLTGPDTLIGGFGPGCCKGRLEQAFTVIAWNNGVRWYRK